MAYAITRSYIAMGNARSGQKITKVKFIVSHDTGNPGSTAKNNRDYFNNHQPNASAHTFIDDNVIMEIVPLNEKAWHVRYDRPEDNKMFGDDANDVAIGVELCWGKEIDFAEAYRRYVWYHAYLCRKFGLNPHDDIVAHSTLDPARRSDPENALNRYGITWKMFIDDVAYSLKGQSAPVAKPEKDSGYKGNSIVDYLKSIGEDSSFSNRARLAKKYGINNYNGEEDENLKLLDLMRKGKAPAAPVKKKLPQGNLTTTSIIDYLKSIGVDSSYDNREKLAVKYGIKGYKGSPSQNLTLMRKIRDSRK